MTTGPNAPYTYYHPTEFRVGSALSRAFEVLFGNFFAFVAISAVASAPILVYDLSKAGHVVAGAYAWTEVLLQFTLTALCEAMILYATFQALRGRPVRPGESIARGLQRFGPIVLVTVLNTLIVALGSLLLVIPGIIASIILCVALPACVVERLGPIESMQRSSALTRGYRWPIFGAFLAFGIVIIIVAALIGGLTAGSSLIWLPAVVTFVWNTLTQAYQTVLVAIIYHDLRVVKDGIDLEHIAAVFD
jgi:hypothetical protein